MRASLKPLGVRALPSLPRAILSRARDDGELHYPRSLIFDVMEGQSDGGLALGSISWWR